MQSYAPTRQFLIPHETPAPNASVSFLFHTTARLPFSLDLEKYMTKSGVIGYLERNWKFYLGGFPYGLARC